MRQSIHSGSRRALGAYGELQAILQNPDRQIRERELEQLGRTGFTAANWQEQVVSIIDLVDREFYLKGAVVEWASINPGAALRFLTSQSFATQCRVIPDAISTWARANPLDAQAWVSNLPGGELKDRSIEALYRSWAIINPELAAAQSLFINDDSAKRRAVMGVVEEWSANNLSAVQAWASSIKNPELRDLAILTVADETSRRSPSEAIRWVTSYLNQSDSPNPEIIAALASKAGFEAPKEIFSWLQTLTPSNQRDSALAGVSSYLAESDQLFAEKGFHQLPAEVQEITVSSVASAFGVRDPAAGQQWLNRLSSNQQETATAAFISAWALRDAEAAAAWVGALDPGALKELAVQALSNIRQSN